MAKINLGDKVKDTVTGFKGTAVGITKWITGCDTVHIQPSVDKDGKVPKSHTVDIVSVEVVAPGKRTITPRKAVIKVPSKKPAKTGGPHPAVINPYER